ncbi:MAG: thiamine pyrophosphate-dependent enzyme [Clostridia bacterium]
MGNGIKMANAVADARKVIAKLGIPTVSTMISMDIVNESALNYGFIGAYGDRAANFIVAKSDLLLSLGARLDVRQVGAKRENFAPNATLIRVEVDEGELAYRVHDNEVAICADVSAVLRVLNDIWDIILLDYSEWLEICSTIRFMLAGMDKRLPNEIVEQISEHIPSNAVNNFATGCWAKPDMGCTVSKELKERQKVVFSGGHGAMGYSLPAAIGCYYASHGPVVSFNGDGGIQMNIQELQTIARERLPIKIVLMNNSALGMIRHFQRNVFGENYVQTVATRGLYCAPGFGAIARSSMELRYYKIESADDVRASLFEEWPLV